MAVRREDQEEFLELCWTAAETGLPWVHRDRLPEKLTCFLPYPIDGDGFDPETVEALLAEGLLEPDGRQVRLTDAGRRQASDVVRRHRLTEVLLHTVLAVSEQSVESTACQVEHILNAEVTEAVCAFLGHPPSCPHGLDIPRGRCCEQEPARLQPLIAVLAELAVGETATVAFIHSRRHAYLQRLSALGVVPGTRIRLRQRHPALVLQIGETELALDHEAGREIFIRRMVVNT